MVVGVRVRSMVLPSRQHLHHTGRQTTTAYSIFRCRRTDDPNERSRASRSHADGQEHRLKSKYLALVEIDPCSFCRSSSKAWLARLMQGSQATLI